MVAVMGWPTTASRLLSVILRNISSLEMEYALLLLGRDEALEAPPFATLMENGLELRVLFFVFALAAGMVNSPSLTGISM